VMIKRLWSGKLVDYNTSRKVKEVITERA
jgi:hypothetical protein